MHRARFVVLALAAGWTLLSLTLTAAHSDNSKSVEHGTQLGEDSIAQLTMDTASKMATNLKLFGLNDVLGPVMHIPFDSSSLVSAVESLRVGYLRHPGGTVANYWNITSGRYAANCSHSSVCDMSGDVDKFPEGTFSAANFVRHLSSLTGEKLPVFDLNVLTMDEDDYDLQVQTLVPYCVDTACWVEIGNELYIQKNNAWRFPDADVYMTKTTSLINRLRQQLPKVKVSVPAGGIGSFLPKSLASTMGYESTPDQRAAGESWSQGLAKHRHLFDAVTIHDYASASHAPAHYDNATRTAALATWPYVAYTEAVAHCKKLYGDDIIMLITEYNNGLGKVSELDQNGGPHALNMLSHILTGVQHGETIQVMQYHAFLSVATVGWDTNSGMVRLADVNATQPYINGVSQLFAQLSALATEYINGSMYSVLVDGAPTTPQTMPEGLRGLSCIQAVGFITGSQQSMAVINRCNEVIPAQFAAADSTGRSASRDPATVTAVSYDCGPDQAGRWVEMPPSTATFPWPGPLPSSVVTEPKTLAAQSFTIVHL